MPIKIHQEPEPTLNLTPMIDIVFLLIIFFMVGTKFTEMERQIELELPGVQHIKTLTDAPKEREVNVYRDNTIMMDRKAYTLDELLTELKRAHEEYNELSILIRGDGDGRYQNVTDVLAACRDAGFERLGIAVRADVTRR
jgi:biopolymer transport protein ExbD